MTLLRLFHQMFSCDDHGAPCTPSKMAKVVRQSGVIPYRLEPDGPKVLLITSRKTRRWVIPKGNIDAGESARKAAEREAYEEAGVRGTIDNTPLGDYEYEKVMRCGTARPMTVKVFGLHLSKTVKKWPEKEVREGEWMTPLEAAERVQEPGLIRLLHQLEQRLTAPSAAWQPQEIAMDLRCATNSATHEAAELRS